MTFTCMRCLADTDNDSDICDDCLAEEEAAHAELLQHNDGFDWWAGMTDAERDREIRTAIKRS